MYKGFAENGGAGMLYRQMPKTKDDISILGFGCMRLPGKGAGIDEEKAIEQIRYAVDQGVNYMDTAWPYHGGKSEVVLGKAVKDGYRDKVKIADKLPHWLCRSIADMDHYLDEQLKRLDTDRIDYYLIHALEGGSWDGAVKQGVVEFMDKAKKSGKIVNAGFSFHGSRDDFKRIIDAYDWDFCQIQFNILDEHFQAGVDGLEYARSKGIGVVIMEPLRGGSLAGKLPDPVEKVFKKMHPEWSNVEWSLRWVWDHPGVITVLSGMNNMDHIEENLRIAGVAEENSMSEEELEAVSKAAEKFRHLMKVPCTGCQYCMPCPHGVNIPLAFAFYNQKHLFKKGLQSRVFYLLQLGGMGEYNPGLASQCVNCGICVEKCPQHINIPVELKKVKREFEGILKRPLMKLIEMGMSKGKKKKNND